MPFRGSFSYAELKAAADSARQQILRVKDVEKADLLGVQDERFTSSFPTEAGRTGSDTRGGRPGTPGAERHGAGRTVFSSQRNLPLRLTGPFDSVNSVANLAVRLEGRTIRVSDFAKVTRGYTDPRNQDALQRQGGHGLGVTMNRKGDVLELGKALETP